MAEGGLSKNDDYECYLKDCPLYTSKKSDKTTSISIKSNSSKRYEYSKFREIIVKHYGEENFKHKGKNGKNGYQCKSAKEKVTLTLYDGTQKLLVQGTGHEQWFKEKFGRLAKQLHDIEMEQPKCQGIQLQQQLATQQPIHKKISGQRSPQPNSRQQQSPVTGSEPLVSLKEFQTQFAVPKGIFPHTTILLYKYSSNATTKFKDMPEDTWQRIDNDPQAKDRNYKGEHAESIMIKRLTEIQEDLKEQTDYKGGSYKGIHTINVILNYSPCNKDPHFCSTRLCEFKTSLEEDIKSAAEAFNDNNASDITAVINEKFSKLAVKEKDEEVPKIKITLNFANFFRSNNVESIKGLKNLQTNGIELDVLTGDKWNDFYKAIGFELPAGREDREHDIKVEFEKLAD